MNELIQAYKQVSKRVLELNDKLKDTQNEIARLSSSFPGDTSRRIAKLTQQLEKIDEYMLKIKGFQDLAQKNMDTQNVLTIEAPPGYRVNLNRLRNWAMMIDPTSSSDPYAQRVYVVSRCDQCFLEQKREEFTKRISQLKADQTVGTSLEIEQLKEKLGHLNKALDEYIAGPEMDAFACQVAAENDRFWRRDAPENFKNVKTAPETIAPGAFAAPLSFGPEQKERVKAILGEFYDEATGQVLLPAEMNNRQEYVLRVACAPVRRKALDRALQNLILTTIQESPAGSRRVCVLDGVRFNSSSLGTLRQLEGTYALEQIPRNPDQLTAALEQMVSSFSDIDEVLELHDSVAEYNDGVPVDKLLPLTTLVIIGWPGAFEGRDRELLQRIMTNYERYGVSLVTVSYQSADQGRERDPMPEFADQNAVRVDMLQNETTITLPGGSPQRFRWYTLEQELSGGYAKSLLACGVEQDRVGNEYIKRAGNDLMNRPPYIRGYRKVELPFGIDGKDQDHSLSFENENFATYLVGASRSGKSTLLHTLIAGLIRNYHPDNLELWLADFKQLEFKRYIRHCPPHVKYVLLDESTELVYDLIDRITAEMMSRQKQFSRLGIQRLDEVDPMKLEKPLPIIFVILDEFSIMSQSIAESPVYKLRLQNVLAKGAALGIKFLFSSQTFTTGVAGLTATARAQIQQRIAMKGSLEEISETLELSSALKTEQVRNWMDALPPHYALVKFRVSADTLPQVKRFLVMYFKNYTPLDSMIEDIRTSMHPVERYTPTDLNSYCGKHPVLVDGNTFDAFDREGFLQYIHSLRRQGDSTLSGGEMFLSFGTPRLMVKYRTAALSTETRENILLIARAAEQACAASILASAISSFQAQGGEVQIWAYGRNRLYRVYKSVFAAMGVELVEDIDAVCDKVRSMKAALTGKRAANTLIVLIGMDRICMDFDYVDGEVSTRSEKEKTTIAEIRKGFEERGAVVSSDEDERLRQKAVAWATRKSRLRDELKTAGKSRQEIKKLLEEECTRFEEEYTAQQPEERPETAAMGDQKVQKIPEPLENLREQPEQEEVPVTGAYNAQEDFLHVLKQGSRLGYHFLLALNNFADLKQCGLKPDFFRYRLAFQVSADDSRALFNSKVASTLPEHICQFDDTLERFSLRPYLHQNIGWDGWYVDQNGQVISPFAEGG